VYSIDINATWFDLDENGIIPLKLFPNPAQTEVTVQAEEIIYIRILDVMGQMILEKDYAKADMVKFNIGHLRQGVYVVEITTSKGKTAQRLVVSR
jgi:hypothetical protein